MTHLLFLLCEELLLCLELLQFLRFLKLQTGQMRFLGFVAELYVVKESVDLRMEFIWVELSLRVVYVV